MSESNPLLGLTNGLHMPMRDELKRIKRSTILTKSKVLIVQLVFILIEENVWRMFNPR
jgi:hypothetical protein